MVDIKDLMEEKKLMESLISDTINRFLNKHKGIYVDIDVTLMDVSSMAQDQKGFIATCQITMSLK